MPSMMAIVSKAVFEKDARGKSVGDVWPTKRYVSANKALAQLAGGDLYLVTVRPPNEALWLVAILRRPGFDDTQWAASPNTQPIRDISDLKTQLKFSNGQGLPSKAGSLGMSLQTPRVLTAADLALLSAESPVSVDDDESVPGGHLESALAHLRAHQLDASLDALLDAWADAPHPRLAELIAMLSANVRTPTPANVRGKTAAARAAWNEHAKKPKAADIPMLLESLVDVSSTDAVDRLPVVAKWMPDPRIDAAFVDILEAVPYRATSTQTFWRRLLPLMREIRDPAQVARISRITFEGVAATMRTWLFDQQNKLLVALEGLETPEPSPLLDHLAVAISGKHAEGAADRASVEDLYRHVYEAPHDDGPRIVLADALGERGDLRGEFITVQLRLAHEPPESDARALRAREKELLDAHGRAWLGELAPILMADYRFERGFLAACKIDSSKPDRVRKLAGHPAWSTVHTLEGSALIGLDAVMRSLRVLAFNQGNARSEVPDAWRNLLVDVPRELEELRYENIQSERQWLDTVEGRRQVNVSDQSEVDALCRCDALPKLKRLTIRDQPVLYIGKLVRAPVLDRLDALAFAYDRNNRFDQARRSPIIDFTQLLQEARVPRVAFEIGSFHETLLELERDPSKRSGYERARMTVGPTTSSNWSAQLVEEAIRILDALPKTVRELRLSTRATTETQQVARLRAAATQQLSLELVD